MKEIHPLNLSNAKEQQEPHHQQKSYGTDFQIPILGPSTIASRNLEYLLKQQNSTRDCDWNIREILEQIMVG